jgi:two-component system, NtrC family, response regulator HydG
MTARRILCVDDHADTCALIAVILNDYEVIAASSKSEGLRIAKSQPFDLILLDYHLRDGNGPELSKQIRVLNQKIPILFVTGTYAMTRSEVLEAGAQGVIRKNDLADVLPRAVRELFAIYNRKASP